MAKKESLKLDDFDLDDMVFDDGFGDIDSQINPEVKKSKKRAAITDVFKGTISGATGRVADPEFLATVTKASLPESYGSVFNAVDQVAGTVSNIYEDAVKEMKPQASRIAKKIDKLVPVEQKSLKSLTTKISNFFGDESKLPDVSKQQQQEQGIQSSLGEIFHATQDANQAAEARGNAEDRVRDSVEHKRFTSNFGLLNQINQNTGIVAQYTQKITQAYQKKSLELQYRSFFAQSELLQTTTRFFEIFKNQGEAITKNTALPEFVKINTSEMFKQQSYNKFITGAQNALFGDKSPIGKGLAKLKKDAKQYVGGIKQGLETALGALEGIESLDEQNKMLVEMGGEPMSGAKIAGIALGSGLADKAGKAASKHVRKFTENHRGIADTGNRAANVVANIPGAISGLRENERYTDARDGGGARGKLFGAFDWLLNNFTDQSPDMKVNNEAGTIKSQQLGSVFDVKTQRSVVDVIPGYLSRILREITVFRTGDDTIGRVLYDQTNGKFVDKAGIAKSINKVLKNKAKSTMLDYRLESLAKSDVGGSATAGHDDDQKGRVKEFYAQLATIPNMDYTPEKIMKTQLFQSLDPVTSKHIKDTLESTITNSADKHANQRALTEGIMNVKQVTPDMRGEIEEFIKAGYGEILIEQGMIKRNENNDYDIIPEAYHKFVRDNAIVKSDKNAKTNIKLAPKEGILDERPKAPVIGKIAPKNNPIAAKKAKRALVKSDVTTKENITYMAPKAALKAVAGTEIYNWNYKHGQGDQQPHTGPMAQDVRRKMGEDAAPGGKALDLTTMNGNNMSAIQALKEEQDKLSKSDTSASILKEIKGDTASMLKFMQEHPGHTHDGEVGVGSVVGGKARVVGDDYKSLMANILQSTASVVGKIGTDMFATSKKTFHFTKDKLVKPTAKKAGELYDDHKDTVVDAFKRLFKKSGEVASRALDTAQDVMFNKLPVGIRQAAVLGGKIKDYVKNFINETKDVYLKNGAKPVLRAALLKAGYYKDAVSGKVIRTLDDLAELKGNIVGPTGELIMTIEEAAEGLVDQTGQTIKTTFHKVMEFGADKFHKGMENAKKFWKKASLLGKDGLEKGKDLAEKGKEKLSKMDLAAGIGFGGGKIYDVLVEIRDLMRGENPERHEDKAKNEAKHQAEFVGPMPQNIADKAKGKLGAITETVKAKLPVIEKAAIKEKVKAVREAVQAKLPQIHDVKEKIDKLKGALKAKLPEKHQEEFVGPLPETLTSKVKEKVGKIKEAVKASIPKITEPEAVKAKVQEKVAAVKEAIKDAPLSNTLSVKNIREQQQRLKKTLSVKNIIEQQQRLRKIPIVQNAINRQPLKFHPTVLNAQKHLADVKAKLPEILPASVKAKDRIKSKVGQIKEKLATAKKEKQVFQDNFIGPHQPTVPQRLKAVKEKLAKVAAKPIIPDKPEVGKVALPPERHEPQMAPEKEAPVVATPDLTPKYRSATNVLDNLGGKVAAVKGIATGAIGAMAGAKGWKGKGLAAIGSLFNKGKPATPEVAKAHHVEHEGNEPKPVEKTPVTPKLKGNKRQVKKKLKLLAEKQQPIFNDTEGTGHRKGSWQDREGELEQRNKDRDAIPRAAVDLKAKYRSDENIIDTMMAKASGIFGMASSGLSTFFGGAGSMLDAASSMIGLKGGGGILSKLGGLGKGALGLVTSPVKTLGAIGRPLVSGISALKNVGSIARVASIAGTVRNAALVGSIMTGGIGSAVMGVVGAGLSAIGAALASPVVLGALAVGAVAYGGYKLFKYITRDNANEFDDIRLKQYGLNGEPTKKYNHLVFKLEDYLNDGKIGYDRGKAYIMDKKIEKEEMLSIFDIDKDDDQACANFASWFGQRFRPFFLTHLTALYSINNKMALSDVPSLKVPEKIKYLNLVGFEGGPYQVDANPFKGLEALNTDKTIALNTIKALVEKLTATDKKDPGKAGVPPVAPPIPKVVPPKVDASIKEKPPEALPKTNLAQPKDKMDDLKNAGEGDGPLKDDHKETGDGPKGSVEGSNPTSLGKIKEAAGPLRDGQGATQYIRMGKDVSLDDVNPSLMKNFKSMIQEYGETTGKSVTITSGARSSAEQAALFKKDPTKAARPGSSMHEFGLAMDVNSADLNALDNAGLMRKYGFTRPVGGEPWHMEPAGIQPRLQEAKNDPNFATQAVEASLFKGGGGAGTTPGSLKGKRNPALAASLLDQSATEVVKDQPKTDKDKVTDVLAMGKPPEAKAPAPSVPPPSPSSTPTAPGEAPMQQVIIKGKRMSTAEKAADMKDDAEVKPAAPSIKTQVGQSEKYSKNADLPTPSVPTADAANDGPPGDAGKGPIDTNDKQQVKKVVEDIAKQQNIDPKKMTAFAAVESGLNPNAKAKSSSATGLFQFTKGTWDAQMAENGRKFNLDPNAQPTDVRASSLLATGLMKSNEKILQAVKPQPNLTDAYMAHFLGPYGAKKFLSANPDQVAADVMPNAAKSNPNIFYANGRPLTVGEVYKKMDSRLVEMAKQFNISVPSNTLGGAPKAANDGAGNTPPDVLSDKPKASVAPAVPVTPPRSLTAGAPTPPNVPATIAPPAPASSVDPMTASAPSMVPPRAKGFLTGQPPTLIAPAMDNQQNRGMTTGMDITGNMNTTMTKQLEVQEKILIAINDLNKTMTTMPKATPTQEKAPQTAPPSPAERPSPASQIANSMTTVVRSAIDLRRRIA